MPDASDDLRPTASTSRAARPGVPLAALFLLAGFAAILIALVIPSSSWNMSRAEPFDLSFSRFCVVISSAIGAVIGAGLGLLRDRSFARATLGLVVGAVVGSVAAMSLVTQIEPGPALIGCAVLVLGAACVRILSEKPPG